MLKDQSLPLWKSFYSVNSRDLFPSLCIDIVRRNLMLITLKQIMFLLEYSGERRLVQFVLNDCELA